MPNTFLYGYRHFLAGDFREIAVQSLDHEQHIMPGRTEADLYLWMMDHRYYLTEQYGQDVGSKVAAQSFTEFHRPPWWQRWASKLQLWWKRTMQRVETKV